MRPVNVCPVSASSVIVASCPIRTFGASVSVKPTLTSRLATLVSSTKPELALVEVELLEDELLELALEDAAPPPADEY